MSEEEEERKPKLIREDEELEHHGTTHRYYPVTKKDHGKKLEKHNFCERANEGMDTNTHTHRYVPAQQEGGIFHYLFGKK
jgi:hypothetical protein